MRKDLFYLASVMFLCGWATLVVSATALGGVYAFAGAIGLGWMMSVLLLLFPETSK